MAASIHDVAKRAGVSISTVSRILNHSAAVSEKKVIAVKEAMEYYNYEPNQFGRGLVMQKSNLVGIYFEMTSRSIFESTYNLELLSGIESVLTQQNYSMVLLSEREKKEHRVEIKPKYMEFIRQKKIDGLLLSSMSNKAIKDEAFRQIMEERFPMVYIGKRVHQNGWNVYAQYEQYTFRMLEELKAQGHRKILLYTGDKHRHYLETLLLWIASEMPEIELHSVVVDGTEAIREQFVEDIKTHVIDQNCTAVCLPSMEGVPILLSVCTQFGITVPERLSIIATEHRMGEGEKFFPAISACYVPAREIGRSAERCC